MTRAIIYIRKPPILSRADLISSDINLERQKNELVSHVAWFQLEVCDTLIESDFSPDVLEQRLALQVALQRMKELEARSLLVNRLDDLTTHAFEFDLLLKLYFENGFTLYAGWERFNSTTPEGRELLGLSRDQAKKVPHTLERLDIS